MSNLKTWARGRNFEHARMIYCLLRLRVTFDNNKKIDVELNFRPFDRKYVPSWRERVSEDNNNRDKFEQMFKLFKEARKEMEVLLKDGHKITNFFTDYYACDAKHTTLSKFARINEQETCEDPVSAAKEVALWVKHTMAYNL